LFTSLKFNKCGIKPEFILANNAEFIQIDDQEVTNKEAMVNLKL